MAVPAQTQPSAVTQLKFSTINPVTQVTETTTEVLQTRVTAAQLLALKTTPVTLIPASLINPNESIWIDNIAMRYNFNTTAYTLNAGTLKVFYGAVANGNALTADLTTNFLTAAATRIIPIIPFLKIGPDTVANMLDVPIMLGNDGAANYTLGDAVLDVTITYGRTTP